MKIKNVMILLGVVLSSTAQAELIKCGEKAEDALAKGRKQYGVILDIEKRIEDPKVVGQHDYAELVRVAILARDPNGNEKFKLARKSFKAIALSEDVMYQISSWKKHGFNMIIFMDELDQTSVSLRGVKGNIRMNCTHPEM